MGMFCPKIFNLKCEKVRVLPTDPLRKKPNLELDTTLVIATDLLACVTGSIYGPMSSKAKKGMKHCFITVKKIQTFFPFCELV